MISDAELEVIKKLSSVLGYHFEVTELPPDLRTKIRNLSQELYKLREKQFEHDLLRNRDLEQEEEREIQNINIAYSSEIEKLEAELKENEKFLDSDYLIEFAVGAFVRLVIIMLIAAIFLVFFNLFLAFLGIINLEMFYFTPISIVAIIFVLKKVAEYLTLVSSCKEERNKLEYRISEIKTQWDQSLNAVKAKYEDLRKQYLIKEEELNRARSLFEVNLNQTASEIDHTLKAAFRKMRVAEENKQIEMKRWVDKTIQKIKEFLKELEI